MWMPRMKKCKLLLILLCGLKSTLYAQDDLLGLLGDEKPKKEFVTNAFKSTRVISSHSMEHVAGGVLDFRILHRFGRINQGPGELFGLDQATIRLGFDYGITDRLTVGFGRSSNKKELDGFIKYRLCWQGKGEGAIPFSLILISSITRDGLKWQDPDRQNFETSRLAYVHQVIIGRKFSNSLSLQLVPTMVHRNLVSTNEESHDIYTLGVGGRVKVSQRIALTGEYFLHLAGNLSDTYTNPLSLGIDIETGGHVFQLHFTNALGMNERAMLIDNTGKWNKGDIHFGFNISRVFTISRPKEFRKRKS